MKGLKVSELKQIINNLTDTDDEVVTIEDIEWMFDEAGDDYEVITRENFFDGREKVILKRENKIKKAALSFWANKKAGESK